ncbi:unnamed protein product [Symbiodinium sp. CCMP2592]|nr:unnamed protein product [Symbiodinium sp. CCMP2592]
MYADYQTSPQDEFGRQLRITDTAIKTVQLAIKQLEQTVQSEHDDDKQCQLEYLKGFVAGYGKGKLMLKIKDATIDHKYQELTLAPGQNGVDEEATLQVLDDVYNKMTKFLRVYETASQELLRVPATWFSSQVYVTVTNNLKAVGLVATASAFVAGFFRLFHCCFSHVCHPAVTAGRVALCGGAVGGGIMFFLVVGYGLYETYKYRSQHDEAQSELQKIEEMVETLKRLPDTDFLRQLDEIIVTHSQVTGCIPPEADRKCLICLEDGASVVNPIKAQRCGGHHYACAACWEEYVRTSPLGPVCPVCRI